MKTSSTTPTSRPINSKIEKRGRAAIKRGEKRRESIKQPPPPRYFSRADKNDGIYRADLYTDPPRPFFFLFFFSPCISSIPVYAHTHTHTRHPQPPLFHTWNVSIAWRPGSTDWITPGRVAISSFDYWFTTGLVGEAFAHRRFLFFSLCLISPSPSLCATSSSLPLERPRGAGGPKRAPN